MNGPAIYTFEEWKKSTLDSDPFYQYIENHLGINFKGDSPSIKELKMILKAKEEAFDMIVEMKVSELNTAFQRNYRMAVDKEFFYKNELSTIRDKLARTNFYLHNNAGTRLSYIISGADYLIIKERFEKFLKTGVINNQDLPTNESFEAAIYTNHIKWLENDFIKEPYLKLENFIKGSTVEYFLLTRILVGLRSTNEKDFGKKFIEESQPGFIKWVYRNLPGKRYLSALILQLWELGWIDLVRFDDKPISSRELQKITENTFGHDIGRKNANLVLEKTRFEPRYSEPFKKIPPPGAW